MILNTTSNYHKDKNLPNLYIPFDPKYLYCENKTAMNNENYQNNLFSADYTEPTLEVGLEQLMDQRQEILSSKIQMIHSEIYKRHTLADTNLYQINLDQCTCRNLIYRIGNEFFDKKRIELERKIIDLEEEKRREKANSFKDVLFLQKELRETLIEEQEEEQKVKMLINQAEDLTCNM
jgi:hypothetical protein